MTTQGSTQACTQQVTRCYRCGSTTRKDRGARLQLRAQRSRERAELLERFGTLGRREREVAMMIARGLASSEIAEALEITPKTVSTHRARALDKLRLTGNAEIAVAAYKAGLLE